jgi:dienelactone hydrolase
MVRIVKRLLLITITLLVFLAVGLYLFTTFYIPPLSQNYGKVDARLFVGEKNNQPLIVAFGGSQGGNTWSEPYWAKIRSEFVRQGYAVLSIGYFNTPHTPERCDRISLNAIYDTIKKVSKHPKVNARKIALLGSSKGGELVLNLASRYAEIDAVVALVPSHVTFPAAISTGNTSTWMYHDGQVPTFDVPLAAIWLFLIGKPQKGLELIFKEEKYWRKAAIEVEKIKGPVLILSAVDDQAWPSQYMSEKIVERLKDNQFGYYFEHFSFQGGHYATKNHFDVVFKFLDEHFKSERRLEAIR